MLFLSLLSSEERTAVYDGATEQDRVYRDELIRSLGKAGYLQAQGMYPGRVRRGQSLGALPPIPRLGS